MEFRHAPSGPSTSARGNLFDDSGCLAGLPRAFGGGEKGRLGGGEAIYRMPDRRISEGRRAGGLLIGLLELRITVADPALGYFTSQRGGGEAIYRMPNRRRSEGRRAGRLLIGLLEKRVTVADLVLRRFSGQCGRSETDDEEGGESDLGLGQHGCNSCLG